MEGEYNPELARRLNQEIGTRDEKEKREEEADAIESTFIRLLVKINLTIEQLGRSMGKMGDFVTPIEELLSTEGLEKRLSSQVGFAHEEANELEQEHGVLMERARNARAAIAEFENDSRTMALVSKALESVSALSELADFERQYLQSGGRPEKTA